MIIAQPMKIDFISLEEAEKYTDYLTRYPFQLFAYQKLFLTHFSPQRDTIFFAHIQTEKGNFLFGFEIVDAKVVLIGMKPVLNSQEITDFGAITSTRDALLSDNLLKSLHEKIYIEKHVDCIEYDYLPENSELFILLKSMETSEIMKQEVSPLIELPNSWDLYLETLERVERKELKRKWRRLDTVAHEFRFVDLSAQDEYFELFIKLHRLSDHNKEQFMTEPMKTFFKHLSLLSLPKWQQKLAFLFIENKPAASVFYFENNTELLLYNSGYNPEYKYYSAGLLLTANLIKEAIAQGRKRFDFLRGNERYKYDLGGKDIVLYRVLFHRTKSTSS